MVDVHSKIRLGFVDKKLILVGVGGFVCWRRRLFNLAEKIMPQFVQYRAKNALGLKKLYGRAIFFVMLPFILENADTMGERIGRIEPIKTDFFTQML
jgi:hypothetical protein